MSKKSAPEFEAAPATAIVKTIEEWCIELDTPLWLFAGTKLGKQWPVGKECTRAEYEAACDWAANVDCR